MNEKLQNYIWQVLLERYGLDIANATRYFSTQNYAYIFPGGEYMLRVSLTGKKTRSEIMSELMWLDDLKLFKKTVCEPSLSKNGNLLEEFEYEGRTYRASMFRTARGSIKPTAEMTPMFFICVGDLLGTIHHISTDERMLGIQFQRNRKADEFAALKARVADRVPQEILQRIDRLQEAVNALPQDLGRYGLCHGDFHSNNFFVEENNVWVFDFDGCGYAHYLYDAASFIQACFLYGYGAGKDLRRVMNEELLPYFKIGYGLNKECDEHYWDDLELFLAYRTAYTYLCLLEIDTVGISDNTQRIKQFFTAIISRDDILDAMSQIMGYTG